jgi:hypothetical protein
MPLRVQVQQQASILLTIVQMFIAYVQVTFCLCSLLLTCLALTYVLTRAKPVYLRDFHVFKPPDECVQAQESTLLHATPVLQHCIAPPV